MRLLDRLKKWFFKEENIGIINIGDLIQIPGREYFKDDTDKLDLIDKYKEEYLSKLNSKNTLYSGDLSTSDLQSELLMNVDLVLKLVVNHNNDLYDKIKKSKLDNAIDMYKLRLYLNRIEEMENDTISRLIALKELEKGKRVPHKNRNALKEQINILTTNLIIFMNQKRAINTEINTYLSNIVIDEDTIDNIDNRLNELISMASLYIDIDDVISMDIKSEIKIAIIERRLEIFCYRNEKMRNRLTEELKETQNKISKVVYSGSYYYREGILNQLTELEKKYEILIRYGYKIVSDEEIKEFYRLKFDVYTHDIVDNEYLRVPSYLIKRFNDRELEAYKNILQQKIEAIIRGRNDFFNKQFDDSSYFNATLSNAIKLFVKYLKDNSFDLEDILKDPTAERLSFILSFDSEDGFNRFFNKKLRRSHDIPIGALDSYVFQYEKELPLSTVLRVIIPDVLGEHIIHVYFKELYQLYHLHLKTIRSDYYEMPDGIISIYAHKNTIDEDYFSKKMRKEAKGKTIIMPNTLKQISGNLFEGVEIKGIILNDSLESLGSHALDSVSDNGLMPPKSLLHADPQVLAKLPNGAFPLFLRVLQENEKQNLNKLTLGLLDSNNDKPEKKLSHK